MLVSVNNGGLTFSDNAYGRTKTLSAYVCTPDRTIRCRVRGIRSFTVAAKGFNDMSVISFEVAKHVVNQSTLVHEVDEAYDYLHAFCLIYIPEFGKYGYFLINKEPDISARGRLDESKTFEAVSYEGILQYENLVGFEINQGTEASLEMFEENLDELRMPQRNIQLYDPEDARYSLLDLVLKDDYYGWSVGEVDMVLRTRQRSFAVQSQNVYSFLCGDVSQAFRCVFTFDTVNKLINCYDIETVGENTNIYLSLDHLLSEIDIAPRAENPVTVFRVAGGNDLGIERVNFGSDKIVNISYPLSMLNQTLRENYATYVETRDGLREQYANAAKNYAMELEVEQAILDRQPDDAINNNWSSTVYYPTEDLRKYLAVYQNAVEAIEGLYADAETGEPDMDALNASPDAALYHSYKDVCIPDIQNELEYRENETAYERVDAATVWELYGLNDLELKKTTYEALCAALAQQGYDGEWDASSTISEETFIAHHQEYETYQDYIEELDELITTKRAKVAASRATQQTLLDTMSSLASRAGLEYYKGTLFTENDIAVIRSLYREADYKNENILITNIDDEASTAVKANDLYEDAEQRLDVEAVPQLNWTVTSANLFAMKDFQALRNQLQVGSFVNLYYGGSLYDPATETFIDRQTLKFRVTEIDFDGINYDGTFTLTFSDMVQTKMYRNDLESLLGTMVASQTNSITSNATSAASSAAVNIATTMIRPYIEILSAQIQEASIDKADIINLTAFNAQIETLVAEYIDAHSADITHLTTGLIESADHSSYWNLDTGVLCLNGYIISTQVEYAVHSSDSTPPAENSQSWSTTRPETTTANPYIWMRTKMVLDGNPSQTISYSAPALISGEDGESPVYVQIDSSAGNIFKGNNISSILTCTVWKGGEDITSQVTQFKWTRKDASGELDTSWTRIITTGNSIQIDANDVTSKAIFGCEVTLP